MRVASRASARASSSSPDSADRTCIRKINVNEVTYSDVTWYKP